MALNYDYGGRGEYEDTTPEELAAIVAPPTATNPAVVQTPAAPSPIDTLTQQILGQNLTSKWSGEGFGSAEKNAADMAKILADAGITNIKDFGKIEKVIPAHEEYQPGASESQEGSMVTVPEQTITAFGNKKTGQELANTYGERQTGDFFGGTYSGKGNTGYGVKFADNGTPIFYTAGASSNDFAQLMKDLGPLGNIALAAVGGPMAVATMGVLSGKPPGDILKSAALSYLGGQAGNFVSGAEGITDILGDVGTNIAANAAKQYVSSGGKGINATNLLLGGASSFLGGSGDGPNSADFEEGYFRPGGEGFANTDAQGVDNFLKSIGINSVDDLADSGLSNSDIQNLIGASNTDEFLQSIGINNVDDLKDSGLSNDDIQNLINGDLDYLASVDDDFSSTYTDEDDTEGDDTEGDTEEEEEATTAKTNIAGGGAGKTTKTSGTGKTIKTGGTGKTIKTTGTKTTGTKTTGTKTTGTTGVKNTGVKNIGVKTTNGATSGLTTTDVTNNTNAAETLAGILAGTGTTAAAKTAAKAKPAATTKNPAVDAITNMAQQQQNQQTDLLNVMGGKDELAKIKSYKDLYGDELFGDSYVPPSAGGDSEEEFFNGGHIDNLSVDALLHMLRN